MHSHSSDSGRIARAMFRSCCVPGAEAPYDRASLKIFYPATPDDSEEQRNSGVVPVDDSGSPYPVLIMMPGINVGPESYSWLASELAARGVVVVTYSMIAEEMPGYISLTPGLNLGAITPETYGKEASATALGAIIGAVKLENAAGVLEGRIDDDKIVIAGHSAGGSVALYNANPTWFPGVRGAISYAAHSAASTMLGFADNTVLSLSDAVPLMIIGGTRDGVIASSAHRYGETGDTCDRLQQTFDDGVSRNSNDSFLIMIEGANHFSLAWPVDESTGRHFLDQSEQGDGGEIRSLLANLFYGFILDACAGDSTASRVNAFEQHELVSSFQRR